MYLIKNATVHIGNGTVLQQSDVLVEGKVIKEVGKDLSAEGAEVIDASGCEVFPGFIDPVSSIGAMGIPGRYLDNNEATNPITPEMNLRYSMDPDEVNRQEFYKSGITTVGLSPTNNNIMGGQIASEDERASCQRTCRIKVQCNQQCKRNLWFPRSASKDKDGNFLPVCRKPAQSKSRKGRKTHRGAESNLRCI